MELKGKTIAFLGDSITFGHGVTDMQNRYDNVLWREAGLKEVYNDGISGTRIGYQHEPSENPSFDLYFAGRACLLPESDIIVVFGGTNDYGHGDAPFGKPGDSTPLTFHGAVRHLMDILYEWHPKTRVVVMLPARRVGDEQVSADACKLPDAKPLIEYNRVIGEEARAHGYAVLDLYHDLGIDPNDAAQRLRYAPDGLHFNDAGHHVIAKKLRDFLEAL